MAGLQHRRIAIEHHARSGLDLAVRPGAAAEQAPALRALAREVGRDKIGVNAITPGFTESETQIASSSSNYVTGHEQGRAFARAQYPDDLVGAAMFLISDASGFITGQTINVDGGEAMH